MNLWQAILVHTLAASLLVAGVGPCPCVGVASGTISGSANSCGMNHATGSGQLLLLLLDGWLKAMRRHALFPSASAKNRHTGRRSGEPSRRN